MTARLVMVPAFGIALAALYGLSWFALGRAFTDRTLLGVCFVGVAGAVSGGGALASTYLLAGRPWTVRFSVALLLISLGPAVVTSLLLAVHTTWRMRSMSTLPIKAILFFVGENSISAFYGLLSLVGFMILPVLLVTLRFAFIFAHRPPVATQ